MTVSFITTIWLGLEVDKANSLNAIDQHSTGGFGQCNQTINWNKSDKIWKGEDRIAIVCRLYNLHKNTRELINYEK